MIPELFIIKNTEFTSVSFSSSHSLEGLDLCLGWMVELRPSMLCKNNLIWSINLSIILFYGKAKKDNLASVVFRPKTFIIRSLQPNYGRIFETLSKIAFEIRKKVSLSHKSLSLPNRTEFRSMDSYIQILYRFQKFKWKVPPPSLPCTEK